jgi:DnaJ-domain-containing protein 1
MRPSPYDRVTLPQQVMLLKVFGVLAVLAVAAFELLREPMVSLGILVALALLLGVGIRGPLLRLLAGLVLLFYAGFVRPGEAIAGPRGGFTLDLLLGIVGFVTGIRAVGPLVRGLSREGRLRQRGARALDAEFERASLPRRIFFLLLAVAQADGRVERAEREMVRRFLLRRFIDPITADDLRSWESQLLPTADVAVLAARIAVSIDLRERDTLFYWCCLVAFADGSFRQQEHDALQRVARGLGLRSDHARSLFHLARDRVVRDGPQRAPDDPSWRNGAPPPNSRAAALATLGLPVDASIETIRRRHRELVKQFHPDAQPNLGPIAQQEATERFRAVQRAYETLTAS